MGDLTRFNIKQIKDEYKLNHYVETGTGSGFCLSIAIENNFEKYFSIEIFEPIFEKAKEKFNNYNNVTIINDNSVNGLKKIINSIDKSCLFFLDAHFPGADFGYKTYEEEKNKNIRIPLETELEVLKNFKYINNSYLIIDDLRIYEDGPFENGNWDQRKTLGDNNIDFIYSLYDNTHDIEKNYQQEGFIILKPKK